MEGEPYEYESLDVRYVGMYVHSCEMYIVHMNSAFKHCTACTNTHLAVSLVCSLSKCLLLTAGYQ